VPRSKNEWSYTSTPQIRLHGVVISESTGANLAYLTLSYLAISTDKEQNQPLRGAELMYGSP
jgi:hypothetical protein